MAFSGNSTQVHLGETGQNALAHKISSTTLFDVGKVQVALMPSLKRGNCISMKKDLSTSDQWCIDSSNVRASKDAAGTSIKTTLNQAVVRSHGGFGSKFHLVTDGKGRPLILDKARYRNRRSFGWLKKFYRSSARYEKLAGRFAAFIKLAFCLRYLQELLVDSKPAFFEYNLGIKGT